MIFVKDRIFKFVPFCLLSPFMMIREAVNLYNKGWLFAYPVLYQEEKDDNTDKPKHTLPEEERQQRAQQRAENRERITELKKEIEQRNSTLMPKIRTTLADLSDRDNVVFWTIRDSAERGIDAKDISMIFFTFLSTRPLQEVAIPRVS